MRHIMAKACRRRAVRRITRHRYALGFTPWSICWATGGWAEDAVSHDGCGAAGLRGNLDANLLA